MIKHFITSILSILSVLLVGTPPAKNSLHRQPTREDRRKAIKRKISEAEGFTVRLCMKHHAHGGRSDVHQNADIAQILHEDAQRAYEKRHSRKEFIDLIHKTEFKSCIGHDSLARCLSRLTGKRILYNRAAIQVNYDDVILLVSLSGRLPERPNYVEYKGRLNFSLLRFEKQTQLDIENSLNKIKEITMEAI